MNDTMKRIREAEAATPHIDVNAVVLAEAPEPPDLDLDRYAELYNELKKTDQRCSLAQDYAVWINTLSLVNQIKSLAQAEFLPGPAVERLKTVGIRPPRKWMLCQTCGGSGDGDIGYCRLCSGHGYRI